jgi:hypothetical protein
MDFDTGPPMHEHRNALSEQKYEEREEQSKPI